MGANLRILEVGSQFVDRPVVGRQAAAPVIVITGIEIRIGEVRLAGIFQEVQSSKQGGDQKYAQKNDPLARSCNAGRTATPRMRRIPMVFLRRRRRTRGCQRGTGTFSARAHRIAIRQFNSWIEIRLHAISLESIKKLTYAKGHRFTPDSVPQTVCDSVVSAGRWPVDRR